MNQSRYVQPGVSLLVSLLKSTLYGCVFLHPGLLACADEWRPQPVLQLPRQPGLPDVLRFADGSKVPRPADWPRRRGEIKEMLLYHQYGRMPPRPDRVVGTVTKETRHPSNQGEMQWITLSIGSQHQLAMRIVVYRPDGPGPFPVILREEGTLGRTREVPLFLEKGYMFIEYARHDLDPDKRDVVGPAQRAYPDYDWATLAVWAWGGMRVVDYLELRNDVDQKRIAITGHSRGGKMALLAGALDERFALVVPNGSGAGGAGSYRILGPGAESLSMNDKPHWYHARILDFDGNIDRLPFDQHFLKSLVAPRLLLCTESTDDEFANPQGTQATSIAVNRVYDFLGVDTRRNGLRYRRGKHDSSTEDWQALLEFAEWHFRDQLPQYPAIFWMTPFPLPPSLGDSDWRPAPPQRADVPSPEHPPVEVEFRAIRGPGNPPDANYFGRGAYGSVGSTYSIAARKVSNSDYAVFLNAVAVRDKYELYHAGMGGTDGGIRQSLRDDRASYQVRPSKRDDPVNYVSWFSALRYCNWLHHGKPVVADAEPATESGAYQFTALTEVSGRQRGARFFLPSENEWYKAAYWLPDQSYGLFHERPDGRPEAAYRRLLRPSVLLDIESGWEWNESQVSRLFRGLRSGAWFLGNNIQSAGRFYSNPEWQLRNVSFRVARPLSEP